MIRPAKDLSPDQRLVVENLIGETLSETDNISVRRLRPSTQLSGQRRQDILSALESYFAKIDVQRQIVSQEEADAAINEALRSTRPNYRPVR